MKLFAALLVLASAQSALAFSPTDRTAVQADLDALKASGLVCVEKVVKSKEDYPSRVEMKLLCGKTEETATTLTATIDYSIANPQSRCASWTAIKFTKVN